MNLFVCNVCGCVDSTRSYAFDGEYKCTKCKTGEWHHLFEQEQYDPAKHSMVLNRAGPMTHDGSEVSLG